MEDIDNTVVSFSDSQNAEEHNRLRVVRSERSGMYEFLDDQGNRVVPHTYDSVKELHDGFRVYWGAREFPGKFGFIDNQGNEVIPAEYDLLGGFSSCFYDGLCCVNKNDKWGFVDRQGKEAIPLKYEYADSFRGGISCVKKNGKYGFIDTQGKEVIPFVYDDSPTGSYEGVDYFHDGCFIKKNGKYGAIDMQGNEVVPFIYERCLLLSLWCVKKNGKYGLIDKQGNEMVPCKYDEIDRYYAGLWRVKKNDKYGLINKKGDEIIPCKYDEIDKYNDSIGFWRVEKNGKYGFVNKQGNEVVPCILEFQNGNYVSSSYIIKKQNSTYGLYNLNEEKLVSNDYKDPSEVIASMLITTHNEIKSDLYSYCLGNKNVMIVKEGSLTIGCSKQYLFDSTNQKGFIQLSTENGLLSIEIVIKNYGNQKENVVPDGIITFVSSTDSLSFNYTGGEITFIPSSRQWVSTGRIILPEDSVIKIIQGDFVVKTLQNETIPLNMSYEDYLSLKYLVCPTACSDAQLSMLQKLVDEEKQKEAELKAKEVELQNKLTEEERLGKTEREKNKKDPLIQEEEKKEEKEQSKKGSIIWSIVVLLLCLYGLTVYESGTFFFYVAVVLGILNALALVDYYIKK